MIFSLVKLYRSPAAGLSTSPARLPDHLALICRVSKNPFHGILFKKIQPLRQVFYIELIGPVRAIRYPMCMEHRTFPQFARCVNPLAVPVVLSRRRVKWPLLNG